MINDKNFSIKNAFLNIYLKSLKINPYDHFSGFFHKRVLRNIVVRVRRKYVPLIYIIRKNIELIERVGYMISCVHEDIFY